MTLTKEQKDALKAGAASAKVQSKLSPQDNTAWQEEEESRDREKFGPLPSSPVENFPQNVLDQDVSRETFQRSAGLEQANLDPYTDDNGTVHLPKHDYDGQSVDDLPWNGQPFHDEEVGQIRSLTSTVDATLVEGYTTPAGATEEQLDALSENIFSYIGPVPVHLSRYTNKWIKVLGCVVQPLQGDVTDKETGEFKPNFKWQRALFKLDKVDLDTETNVIIYGGGMRGLQLARHFNSYKQVGDWQKPRMIYIQMETRENSHVMYGFRHRACVEGE